MKNKINFIDKEYEKCFVKGFPFGGIGIICFKQNEIKKEKNK